MRAHVARIITHPSYNSDTADFDVAVLELGRPLPFSRHVQPVCLPAASHIFPPRKKCLISGWGYLKENFCKHPPPAARLPAQYDQANITRSGLVSCEFCICKFAHLRKCICPPQVDTCRGLWSSTMCGIFPMRWRSLVTPCLLGSAETGNWCPFSGLFTTMVFFFSFIFVLSVASLTKSKQAPSIELTC